MSQTRQPLEILKKYWGYDSFRLNQEAIISSVLSNRDTLALLPTGGGKSLCYQVPALTKKGVCLVVSPLIALMVDQVNTLKEKGIPARVVYSGMSNSEIELILNNCLYGKVKILYVSPERLSSPLFISYFEKMMINLIAVDEAHCISQWGYNFRPSFLKIADIRKYHPNVPVLALTATATKDVIDDIQEKLEFREKNSLASSFERANLSYTVFEEPDKITKIQRVIENIGGSGLIYVRSRKKATELANSLAALKVSVAAYHAGLTIPHRNKIQKDWMEDRVNVVVATTAFGMGIDKQNVSYVIHYDLPESIEAYFQEVGRAGRDGKKSYGVLLYTEKDKKRLLETINANFPDIKYILNVYNGISNYFQVPVGTGIDRRFDWDIVSFSQNYNLEPFLVFNSVRILENSGLLEIAENRNPFSKIKIIVDRTTLYNFMIEYPMYYNLLEALRRMYTGVMTEFTIIDEKKISKVCFDTEANTYSNLKRLEKYGVLYYDPKSDKPQLIFTQNRHHKDNFALSEESYHNIKEVNIKKANELIDFISSERCRQQYLLNYFGFQSPACGKCDYCISQKNKPKKVEDMIIEELSQYPRTPDYFSNSIKYGTKETIIPIIRTMLDDGIIILEEGNLKLR